MNVKVSPLSCLLKGQAKEICSMNVRFSNRTEAGQQLAAKLLDYANRPDVIVLALPRGGVPVGYEIARSLNVPLDV